MARPARETPRSSALVPALVRFAGASRVDTSAILDRHGVDPRAGDADEIAATAAAHAELFEAIADGLGEPFFALRAPSALPFPRYGPAELAARASTSVRDALASLAKYASLVHPFLEASFSERAGEGTYVQRAPGMPRGAGRHGDEYGLAYALAQCRLGAGDAVTVERAWFSHARPPSLDALCAFFGTDELSFGCEDSGLAFRERTIHLPMRGGDARLRATAEEIADSALRTAARARSLPDAVAARIAELLPAGANVAVVARAMAMSTRTLQRRLAEHGARFSDLLDRARESRARAELVDPSRSLAQICDALGFADLATFGRAFKRWTGQPPGTWRRLRLGG